MSRVGKWNPPSALVTVLSTEMDALPNDSQTVSSAAVSNNTNLDIYVDVELFLNTFTPPTLGLDTNIVVYLMEAIDGVNYPPAGRYLRSTSTQVFCLFTIGITPTTAYRTVVRQVVLPPGTFKLMVDNLTGAQFAASGNTLKLLPYNVNLVG